MAEEYGKWISVGLLCLLLVGCNGEPGPEVRSSRVAGDIDNLHIIGEQITILAQQRHEYWAITEELLALNDRKVAAIYAKHYPKLKELDDKARQLAERGEK